MPPHLCGWPTQGSCSISAGQRWGSLGSDCTRCPLHHSANSVCVSGRGRDTVGGVLIVGQNPGGEEDIAGKCFVGKAGRLLEELLQEAGYSLSDYRLTNAVRCHTPRNEKPTQKHIDACRDWLKEEIHEYKPRAIIALGDTALQALCKTSGIRSKRGNDTALHATFEYAAMVWPTYHPAYILRIPTLRKTLVDDLKRVLEGVPVRDQIIYTYWDGKPLKGKVIAYDIETDWDYATKTGGDNIVQLAISSREDGTIVERENPLRLAHALLDSGAVLVGHNSWGFDAPKLRAAGVPIGLGDDTMALAYLDDETQPLGLESLCVKYIPNCRGWKEMKTAAIGSEEFAEYNARDALRTLELYEILRERIGDRYRILDYILRPAREALDALAVRGVYISAEAVQEAKAHFEAEIEKAQKNVTSDPAVNLRSSIHVGRLLEAEGHKLRKTATGLPGTGAKIVGSLRRTELVQNLISYRKAVKAYDAFVKPYEKIAQEAPDSRAHSTYTLVRTLTGRTSCSNPNLQQIPRDPLLKGMLSAPDGLERCTVDYSAIEFRLAVFLAGQLDVVERFADGNFDPHRWFASKLYGVSEASVTKTQRQIAKSANFGLMYGSSASGLVDYCGKSGIHITLKEATSIRLAWHKAYPAFGPWYKQVWEELKEKGYVESLTGRRRHFGDVSLMSRSDRNEALRQAINFLVQSLAADIALIALYCCHQAGLPITDFVHDSIGFEFEAGKSQGMLEVISYLMVTQPMVTLDKLFGVSVGVRLDVEMEVKC